MAILLSGSSKQLNVGKLCFLLLDDAYICKNAFILGLISHSMDSNVDCWRAVSLAEYTATAAQCCKCAVVSQALCIRLLEHCRLWAEKQHYIVQQQT